jgi:hypothetical protein
MKILLQDNGGYKLYAAIRTLPTDSSQHELKFTTVWDGARGSVEELNAAQFILDDQAVENLVKILGGY